MKCSEASEGQVRQAVISLFLMRCLINGKSVKNKDVRPVPSVVYTEQTYRETYRILPVCRVLGQPIL